MEIPVGAIRQGDVFLLPIENKTIPENLPSASLVILALGEATGHAHRLMGPAVYDWQEDGHRYVASDIDAGQLQHEDHDPMPVKVLAPRVVYEVIPQNVLDLKDEWHRVRD